MDDLTEIEIKRGITLPKIYKDFYILCLKAIPKTLVGSDLFNYYPDLNNSAVDLLKENEVENFLERDDFVFLMHQGYVFLYFKADGNSDPIVYRYYEVERKPKNIGHLSELIKDYLQDSH